ncbi:transcription factor Spt20 homolog isoform X2 [Rhodnius prolixus]|uniref:transcription factor Spt20 homolog isoform X2 n=1 Tax=Rhodnius prolixus TaxID=13249 RepID=UPI003D18F209
MQSLHLADDELSCIDLGFAEVTGAGEEVEVSGCESVLSEFEAEWAALVGDGLSGCVVDLPPSAALLPPLSSPPPPVATPALPPPAAPPPPPPTDPLCIHHRLRHLYSQRLTEPFPFPNQYIKPTSFLLKRLLQENSFNMVVITLYPLDKGYTIGLRTVTGKEFQGSVQPYSQNLLLDYINKEELPPMFLDYWETTFPQIFYTGCVLVEVKDARICDPPIVSHVLLKPTTQSLINDVTALLLGDTSGSPCSSDVSLAIEGSIVNNVQPPLSLNPSNEEGRRRCNRHHLRKAMLTRALSSKTSFQNEARSHHEIKMQEIRRKGKQYLYDYTTKKKFNSIPSKPAITSLSPSKVTLTNTPWGGSSEAASNVSSLARPLARPPDTSDNTPEIVEQYILETVSPQLLTTYHIRLTILHRPANSEYLGTLYIDKEYHEGYNNGSLCRFTLGSRANANRYIKQFTDVFTEEGRKSVRITHLVPGKPARVTYTAAMMEKEGKLTAAANLRVHNHTKTAMQVNKNSMHNPAISALANSFRNSVHQYQQQAAAAAATSNVSSNSHRDVGGLVGSMVGSVVENVNMSVTGVSGVGVPTIGVSASVPRQPQPATTGPTVLTLLNKTGVATQTPAFHQQHVTVQPATPAHQFQQPNQHQAQIQAQQHKLVTRKMTISNLIGSRLRPVPSNSCSAIRIPLSTIASQLTPHQQELQVTPDLQPLQQTISVQAYGPHFHPLSGVNLKGLKATSAGMRGFVSGTASSQALHMLSASKEPVGSQPAQQANQVASSLSLSLPGLSALLADIESDA